MPDVNLNADGPHFPEHTREVANLVAEGIRYLNHATRSGDALEYPGDVYDVIGALSIAAGRLPQLLGQLAERLRDQTVALSVADDMGRDPVYLAEMGCAGLESDATTHAAALSRALVSAQNAISGLYVKENPDG